MDKPIDFPGAKQEGAPPPPPNPTAVVCHTCSYFLATKWNETVVIRGECRRHAPTIERINGEPWGVWPIVRGGDTCGEHPARSADIQYRLARYVAVRSQEEASDIVAPGQVL